MNNQNSRDQYDNNTPQETIEQFAENPSGQPAGNIIVVDDNPQNLRLLIAILSMRGYKVRPAPNGMIALESTLSTLPDLILLDIMMPEMDGYEVFQRLKSNHRTSSVPVIFISAIYAVSDKVKAFEMGAVDYITKPFHAEEILARVNTHISLSRARRRLEEEIELRKLSEERLKAISLKYQKMAIQDFLTGVSNRRYFIERAEEELSRAKRYKHPITFFMMDIDHFKKINDTYGHQTGDKVLKNVATVCIDNLRVHDLFGRIGGEEFAALLPETPSDEALPVAERIRKSIEESLWRIDNKVVSCTISIGMSQLIIHESELMDRDSMLEVNGVESESGGGSQTLDQLMKKADEALYSAKSSGRNCVK